VGRVEGRVEGDRQLDGPEATGKVTTGRGADVDQELAQLSGNPLESISVERSERAGIIDRG
jgi:hypothetical protein